MHKKQLLERVNTLCQPICQEAGVQLWDVTFEKEGRNHTLTVFIDRAEGGIFIEDCEKVSRALDPLLDAPEFDSLPSYTLSVSSAGVERRLVRPEHLAWALGKQVACTFYKAGEYGAGVVGTLLGADENTLRLDIGGVEAEIPRVKISGIKMHFEF